MRRASVSIQSSRSSPFQCPAWALGQHNGERIMDPSLVEGHVPQEPSERCQKLCVAGVLHFVDPRVGDLGGL
eukprot:11825101-Alexandrium_andersonii.AAC.1